MRTPLPPTRPAPRFLVLVGPLASLFVAACAGSGAPLPSPAAPGPAAATVPASLPFIDDDFARAVAEAKASHRLVFVDAWAPWCHTCLSMRAYTFRDPKIRARAGEVVWAAIDTEKPGNTAWVASHPMHVWPTLFFIDPESGKSVLEWPSSATADELVRLMDVATHASPDHAGALAKGEALGVELQLDGLLAKKDYAGCVEAADRDLPHVPRGGARAATLALLCASEMPAGDARRAALERAIARVKGMAADDAEPMLPDDRSGLYETMVDVFREDGREADAKSTAGQWASYLEAEAQRAPDATARMVFDAHRVEAYLALGAPERAIPMLEASARDQPGDYNTPFRLARVYLAMKRYPESLAAIDRASSLVYGPRALRVYAVKADVLESQGDRAAAAAALKEGLARVGGDLPPRYAPLAQELLKRERALEAGH